MAPPQREGRPLVTGFWTPATAALRTSGGRSGPVH